MPFNTTRQVPREVRSMPAEVRKVWTAAFTKSMAERPEELAEEAAFAAVKKLFKQQGETWVSTGKGGGVGEEGGGIDPAKLDPESEEYDPTLDPDSDEYDPEAAALAEEEAELEGEEEGDLEEDPDAEFEGEEGELEGGEEGFEGEEDPDLEEEDPEAIEVDPAEEAEGEASQAEEIAAMARAKAKYRARMRAKAVATTGDSMTVTELFTLDAKKFTITQDGFLTCEPRVARTGIQLYKGYEVGRPDLDVVRVFRPEAEVFDKDAMASMAHRTITLEHPDTRVDASNWKKLTIGHSSDPVARDGEFIRVPLVLMDANAIREAQSGRSQLSVGYGAKLVWQSGKTPDGLLYDAVQTEIRANHIALVKAARGGDKLKIGDRRRKTHDSHERRYPMTDRTMNLDGVTIELEDRDYQVLQRHLDAFEKKTKDQSSEVDALKAQIAELQAKLAEAMKRAGTTDGEIAALKQAVEDSKLSPQKLDDAINLRMDVVDRATSFFGDQKYPWMGKSDAQIKRDVVTQRLGDAKAKTMNDDAIDGAFLSITEPPTQDGFTRTVQAFSTAPVRGGGFNDKAAMAYDKRNEELANRFKKNRKPFGASAS